MIEAFLCAALCAPDVHVVAIDKPTGLVNVVSPTAVNQGATGGYCPQVPPNCDHSLAQLSTWWSIVDSDMYPYWALEMKVGCGGYCDGCGIHGWVPCDIQDAFVGISPPDGSPAGNSNHYYNKTFEIVGEGIYAVLHDPNQPHPEWFGPFLMHPRLHNVTFDDPVLPSHPVPNAVWWFTSMSNHDGFTDTGAMDYLRYPDMFLNGEWWDDLCLLLNDVYALVTSLGVYVEWGCPCDITGDGRVGIPDLLDLLANWGLPHDVRDLLTMLWRWGGCPYT